LLFSANQGIRSFGLSALIGELTCVFAALVLAPALLDLRFRRRVRATADLDLDLGRENFGPGSAGLVARM
jgi:hypothetical protein